jgi:hypothetical protein
MLLTAFDCKVMQSPAFCGCGNRAVSMLQQLPGWPSQTSWQDKFQAIMRTKPATMSL